MLQTETETEQMLVKFDQKLESLPGTILTKLLCSPMKELQSLLIIMAIQFRHSIYNIETNNAVFFSLDPNSKKK